MAWYNKLLVAWVIFAWTFPFIALGFAIFQWALR